MSLFKALIFATMVVACHPTLEQGYSELHSDSGIPGKPFSQMIADLTTLSQQNDLAELKTYGQSIEGRPLTAIKIGKKDFSGSGKRPAILISEGIHGNEYTNIADRLPEAFLNDVQSDSTTKRFIERGGVIYIVPIVNPDGYESKRRENSAGKDLNRDFAIKAAGNQGFTQPETKSITQFMSNEVQSNRLSLEASMEYHCCIGGLIHPWAYTATPLPTDVLNRHRAVGAIVQSTFGYRAGTVREIVGYEAIGGSDDYYYETYGKRAFTFEGKQGTENLNFDKHVTMWDQVIEIVLKETPNQPDSPVVDEKLYLALGNDNTIAGSTPIAWTDLKFCVNQVICDSSNALSLTKHATIADRTIFKFGDPISLLQQQENILTFIAELDDKKISQTYKIEPKS